LLTRAARKCSHRAERKQRAKTVRERHCVMIGHRLLTRAARKRTRRAERKQRATIFGPIGTSLAYARGSPHIRSTAL